MNEKNVGSILSVALIMAVILSGFFVLQIVSKPLEKPVSIPTPKLNMNSIPPCELPTYHKSETITCNKTIIYNNLNQSVPVYRPIKIIIVGKEGYIASADVEIKLLASDIVEKGVTDARGCFTTTLPYPSGWVINIIVKKGGQVIYNNSMIAPNMWIWDAESISYNPIVVVVK